MNIEKTVYWNFPPTTNRHGVAHSKHDTKDIVMVSTNIIDEPLIAMSDIHSHTPELVPMLNEYVDLSKFVVVTVGDMAGNYIFGADGDPYEEYKYLKERAFEFYYVQGNHDLPLKNNVDGSIDCKIINTKSNMSIGGVNGIISNKPHAYKIPFGIYLSNMKKVLQKKPYIFVTHDTPSIPMHYPDGSRYIGQNIIYETVDKYKPKIHIYGHCHHPTMINLINNVYYINVDGKVVIFVPEKFSEEDKQKLFKKDLCNLKSKKLDDMLNIK